MQCSKRVQPDGTLKFEFSDKRTRLVMTVEPHTGTGRIGAFSNDGSHYEASKRPVFRQPQKRARLLPPGTWLAMLVKVLSLGFLSPCAGCRSRAKAMDEAGWRGLPRLWWGWVIRRGRRDTPE